jgi:hypothetical protein
MLSEQIKQGLLCLLIIAITPLKGLAQAPELDDEFDSEIMFTPSLDFSPSSSELDDQHSKPPSTLSTLLSQTRLSYQHQVAYTAGAINHFSENRSSLRWQWEYGHGRYFYKANASTEYEFNNDYQLDKNDDSTRIKAHKDQSEIREFYVQINAGAFNISLGKQLVIWGKADGAQVTDVMSPRNLSESVFTELEDARIGQSMLVIHYYKQSTHSTNNTQSSPAFQQQWSLVINPDRKTNQFAPYGELYAPNVNEKTLLQALLSLNSSILASSLSPELFDREIQVSTTQPGFSVKKPEFGLRWLGSKGKLDLAIMAADVLDDAPVLGLHAYPAALPSGAFTPLQLTSYYPRYQILGTGLNLANGAMVWKGELAFKVNRQFSCMTSLHCDFKPSTNHVWDSAFGFDYSANGAFTFSLEASNQHIQGWHPGLLATQRNTTALYSSLSKHWLHETLHGQYTLYYHLQEGESFHRTELRYDYSDYWQLSLQVDYFASEPGQNILGSLADKQRIAFRLEGNF